MSDQSFEELKKDRDRLAAPSTEKRTPRTDAFHRDAHHDPEEWREFARTLERELATAQREIAEARADLAAECAITGSELLDEAQKARIELQEQVSALTAALAEAKANRLELAETCFIAGAESMGDTVSRDYAYSRWTTSDIKKDIETNAL